MFLGFKHSGARNSISGSKHKLSPAETDTVQLSGARFARTSVSRTPLPAIFRFAIIGFGGALFLFYSFFGPGDAIQFAHPKSDLPTYAPRALLRDSQNAGPANQRADQKGGVTVPNDAGTEKVHSTQSNALFSPSARGQLRGVDAFPESRSPNPNPDPSTWVFGAALVALVGARSVHARWRRSQWRAEQKEARSHALARGCAR